MTSFRVNLCYIGEKDAESLIIGYELVCNQITRNWKEKGHSIIHHCYLKFHLFIHLQWKIWISVCSPIHVNMLSGIGAQRNRSLFMKLPFSLPVRFLRRQIGPCLKQQAIRLHIRFNRLTTMGLINTFFRSTIANRLRLLSFPMHGLANYLSTIFLHEFGPGDTLREH